MPTPAFLGSLPGPRFEGTDPDLPVVVTGAGGFIGGWLVRDLLRQGVKTVRAVDIKPFDEWQQRFDDAENLQLDLNNLVACRRATEGMAVVYNLAADMGGMGFIETHKAECMLSVLISTHMLVAAKDAGVQRFFYSSSACVYNADKQEDADVTALVEADAYPAMPEDGYGWEKLFSERMCRHFREDYGLETRVARFHNVYGPLGTWKGGREKAPAALSRKVAEAVLNADPRIDIWGDGEQTRSFMFISDCVYGIQRIMWSDVVEPLNLGSDELVSINQLVALLEDMAYVRLRRSHDLGAPKGVRGRNSDNRLIRRLLGWEPGTSLREGMAVTYAWVREQVAADLAAEAALAAVEG
ncbi:nucleoside-diphosphate-sugar epimerase [Motilibacter rhizosphaerae]|uniref:Nucleoside-diphosphate-sugar epimerase n=1 Tax=Motilibacter rhizosphaerae TaxID=598652 RepID=A0A4V2F4Y5_9ACTN|nr:NAD-dependent epimerase/dehydratase family protein [Motilibacter rhizosphaerae]RZS90939.1 nucleoside-diphosphate-sugar epimerase [Motilibacter rhizosphaerae]